MKLADMNKKLQIANAQLKEKQDALKEVLDQVAALEKKLKDTIDEKDRLINEASVCEGRLKRADILTLGLADESVRWAATVGGITDEIIKLTGDAFLSAAAISYYGPFTGVYRQEIVDAWCSKTKELNIPCSDTFDLKVVM